MAMAEATGKKVQCLHLNRVSGEEGGKLVAGISHKFTAEGKLRPVQEDKAGGFYLPDIMQVYDV